MSFFITILMKESLPYESSSEIFHWDERTQKKKNETPRRNELVLRKTTYEMNNNNDTKTHTQNKNQYKKDNTN